MTAEPLVVGVAALAATLSGGAIALRFHTKLAAMLGFSSGAIIGVALFDLVPEAIELGGAARSPLAVTTSVATGLLGYLLVDWLLSGREQSTIGHRRYLGPASLTVHSFLDGVGIGLAFEVSVAVGLVLAAAVLAHDLLDGANTVVLSVAGGAEKVAARRWLLADAVAPVLGILVSRSVDVSAPNLALLLAFFAGGFLYIGASELLPRSRARADTSVQAFSVGLGLALIYLVVRLSPA